MKRSTFNYIKQILKDYPNIEKHVKERMEELRYPYRPVDVNSDIKGNAIADNMANLMVTIDQDRRLASLERNKRAVDKALDETDETTKTIINELYIVKRPQYTVEGLVQSEKVFCSRSQVFKLRDKFFNELADELKLDK